MGKPPKNSNERYMKGKRKGQFKKKSLSEKRIKKALKKAQAEIASTNTTIENNGRELMKRDHLFEQLWCNNCNIPMSLKSSQVKEVVQRGLGRIYRVECVKCPYVKSVTSDTTFGDKGEYFSINAKAAMGMIDIGIGETQFNSLLSAMNISSVSSNLIKRHERIVGPAIEAAAVESCSKYLEVEKRLTEENNDVVEDK
uniref:Mutator-like transposase domain-containing protein n=1 Tax=Trichogramma kaykai TaxID=54128 RepID=A0ABD2WE49_9HYME